MACRLVGAKPYLNQYWNIINSNHRNKLQWSLFHSRNAFENVFFEIATNLSRPQCVKFWFWRDGLIRGTVFIFTGHAFSFKKIYFHRPYIFIQEIAFENVVCEIATNLSRPQRVKFWFWRDGLIRGTVFIFTGHTFSFKKIYFHRPYIFIQEIAFENVVCEIATKLSRPQCVKFLFWRDGLIRGTVFIFTGQSMFVHRLFVTKPRILIFSHFKRMFDETWPMHF